MKQNHVYLALIVVSLSSCVASTPSSQVSDASLNSSPTTTSIETTLSSLTTTSTSSSLPTSTEVSDSSSDMMVDLATKWATLLDLDSTLYTSESIVLSSAMTSADIVEAVAIYAKENATFYGYAYEANVSGNGGKIRFQIAIVNDTFEAFKAISHYEHTSFGVKIINAFNFNLPGQPATLEAAVAVLIDANAGRSGISETYDGMLPAIEAMVLHAQAV